MTKLTISQYNALSRAEYAQNQGDSDSVLEPEPLNIPDARPLRWLVDPVSTVIRRVGVAVEVAKLTNTRAGDWTLIGAAEPAYPGDVLQLGDELRVVATDEFFKHPKAYVWRHVDTDPYLMHTLFECERFGQGEATANAALARRAEFETKLAGVQVYVDDQYEP